LFRAQVPLAFPTIQANYVSICCTDSGKLTQEVALYSFDGRGDRKYNAGLTGRHSAGKVSSRAALDVDEDCLVRLQARRYECMEWRGGLSNRARSHSEMDVQLGEQGEED
jgi:hypothetical protein